MQALPPVVAIGGSAGAIEALRAILPRLPASLPAAILVVLHRSAVAEDDRLPTALGMKSALPTHHAVHGGELEAGHVYVAPANVHLLAGRGRALLSAGAKANHMRPSIDRLFFSVARMYGSRAVGVILSGLLDDGVAGLADIQAHGGRTLVQDPADAAFADMPRSALGQIEADAVAPADALAALIVSHCEDVMREQPAPQPARAAGESSRFTCPDCGGVLVEYAVGGVAHFRCRTGHEFSSGSFVERQGDALENALFVALRTLDERAEFCQRLATRMRDSRLRVAADRMSAEAKLCRERARVIRDALDGVDELIEEGGFQEVVDATAG